MAYLWYNKEIVFFLEMSDCKTKILEMKKARNVLTNVVKKVVKYKREKTHTNEIQNAESLLEAELNNLDQ